MILKMKLSLRIAASLLIGSNKNSINPKYKLNPYLALSMILQFLQDELALLLPLLAFYVSYYWSMSRLNISICFQEVYDIIASVKRC